MFRNTVTVTILAILLSFHAALAKERTKTDQGPSCLGSLPGFVLRGLPGVSAVESEKGEAGGGTSAQGGPGRIAGGINHSALDMTIDRKSSTITGGANASVVNLRVERETGKITGGANGSRVNLTVRSGDHCTLITGDANASPVNLTIDWKAGIISGHSNHSPVHVAFQRKKGTQRTVLTLEGHANHAPVHLTYDQRSRKLTGGMGHSEVDLTFTGVTLEEFIDYFFLFLDV